MKIGVISDIHGNVTALKTVLEDIKKREIDTVVCLGDLVGYGPFPNEVIEIIRGESILAISGNYDIAVVFNDLKYIKDNDLNKKFALPWSVKEVSEENKKFLKRLPQNLTITDKGKVIQFVHGSTRVVNEYLLEESKEAEEVMKDFEGDVLVCAHTHIPYVKKYGDKILVNDGSIGKPKIGRPNITYSILKIEDDEMDVESVELKYSYMEVIKAMIERGFPGVLVNSIKTGK